MRSWRARLCVDMRGISQIEGNEISEEKPSKALEKAKTGAKLTKFLRHGMGFQCFVSIETEKLKRGLIFFRSFESLAHGRKSVYRIYRSLSRKIATRDIALGLILKE